jgi:hypothetical protein
MVRCTLALCLFAALFCYKSYGALHLGIVFVCGAFLLQILWCAAPWHCVCLRRFFATNIVVRCTLALCLFAALFATNLMVRCTLALVCNLF